MSEANELTHRKKANAQTSKADNKAALDNSLGKLRALSGLIKVCRIFQAKHDTSAVNDADRRALRQAFAAYSGNSITQEMLPLPWCIGSLSLVATLDISQDPPVHPADVFPFDTTARLYNCTLAQ